MDERKWTPDQQNAIEARGGTLLVSAAAGSGKTAVLVERVIQRLLDPVNGCDADRLLVVTFTKAAAGGGGGGGAPPPPPPRPPPPPGGPPGPPPRDTGCFAPRLLFVP